MWTTKYWINYGGLYIFEIFDWQFGPAERLIPECKPVSIQKVNSIVAISMEKIIIDNSHI